MDGRRHPPVARIGLPVITRTVVVQLHPGARHRGVIYRALSGLPPGTRVRLAVGDLGVWDAELGTLDCLADIVARDGLAIDVEGSDAASHAWVEVLRDEVARRVVRR